MNPPYYIPFSSSLELITVLNLVSIISSFFDFQLDLSFLILNIYSITYSTSFCNLLPPHSNIVKELYLN